MHTGAGKGASDPSTSDGPSAELVATIRTAVGAGFFRLGLTPGPELYDPAVILMARTSLDSGLKISAIWRRNLPETLSILALIALPPDEAEILASQSVSQRRTWESATRKFFLGPPPPIRGVPLELWISKDAGGDPSFDSLGMIRALPIEDTLLAKTVADSVVAAAEGLKIAYQHSRQAVGFPKETPPWWVDWKSGRPQLRPG
jgi:hypothetical protein